MLIRVLKAQINVTDYQYRLRPTNQQALEIG
jgi:hypothetical protein